MPRRAWIFAAFLSAIATPSFAASASPKSPPPKPSAAPSASAAATVTEASFEYFIAQAERLITADQQAQIDVLCARLQQLKIEERVLVQHRDAAQTQRNQSTSADANQVLDAQIATLNQEIATLDGEIAATLDKIASLHAAEADNGNQRERALAEVQVPVRDMLQSKKAN